MFYGVAADSNHKYHATIYYFFTLAPNSTTTAVLDFYSFLPFSGPIPLFVDAPLPPIIDFIVFEYENKKKSCGVGEHVGDWDSSVSMLGNFNGTAFEPTLLYYRAHGGRFATKIKANDAEYYVDDQGNQHPHLYSGCLTHPAFPHAINGATGSIDKNGGAGNIWETWKIR